MTHILLGALIGAAIAWHFPQPEWAKKYLDPILTKIIAKAVAKFPILAFLTKK